jgi:IclR family acetate operon transcriptional repressor
MRLGDAVSRQLPIAEVCRPVLQQLADATGMTARAAIADRGWWPVFVERVDGPGSVRFHTALGRREMPHVSSAGKAILAELSDDEVREVVAETGLVAHSRNTITSLDALLADLDRVRRRGYAIDDEEDAEGVFCVGAAFFDHAGRCAGALSTTCIKVDMPSWRIEEIGRVVREHADLLTQRLGGQPHRQER